MFDLIKDKHFKRVFTFSMVYRFIMQLLITPFLLYLGKLLMNYHNIQFMTTDTLVILLSKPSIWIFIIFGLGLMMFLLMLELSSVILLSEYDRPSETLIPLGLNKLKWTLKPKNLIYLPIFMIVILGFHFGVSSIITDAFFIPEFIMDTIVKTPRYMFIYSGVSIIAFIMAFHLVFLFHNFFIGEKSFKNAVKDSISMVSGNRINFLFSAFKLGVKVSVFFTIAYVIIISATAFLIFAIPPFSSFNGVSLSFLFVLNKSLIFIIANVIAAVNVMFLTKKYHEFGGSTSIVEDIENESIKKVATYPKYALLTLVIITVSIQGFGAYQTTVSFNNPEYLEHKVYITSHRGNSSVAPENTLAAISAAKDELADAAEIDVQLTTDGHVVVIHDFKLSRLAKDPRKVVDLTLAEIKELEVGSWFSKEFAGEKIPTLNEVIEEAGNLIKLNIELKPTKDEAELALAVIEILDDYDYHEHVVISSLNIQALKEVKTIAPDLYVGYIIPIAIGRFEFQEDIDFYSLEMSFVNKFLVEKIKNQDKEVHVWTVNSEDDLKKMQRLQVDNIITDNPILAKKILSTNLFERGILEVLSLLGL